MDKLAHVNLEKVCRLCLLQTNTVHTIFTEVTTETFTLNIQKLLTKIVDIELTDAEELPNVVCEKCLQFLVEISRFLQLCLDSDRVIKAYYTELKLQENEVKVNVKEEFFEDEDYDNEDDDNEDEDNVDNGYDLSESENTPEEDARDNSKPEFSYYLQTQESGQKEYVCNLCTLHFITLNEFRSHIFTHGDEPFICNSCKKSYKHYHNLWFHINKRVNEKPNNDSNSTSKKGLKYYLQVQECGQEVHVCNLCSEHFIESCNFKNHLNTHGEEPFVCNQCKRSFKTYQHLINHLKKHLTLTDSQIQLEDEVTNSKKFGSYYLATLKNGQEGYACNLCSEQFKKFKDLKNHLAVHGEKPYACNNCKKGFRNYTLLMVHIRRYTSLVRYKCELCDKSYREKSSLTIHLRTHRGERPYLCSTCGKSFTSITELKVHHRSHLEEGSHVCNYCGVKLRSKGSFNIHLRSHTGEKPFLCSECPKAFTSSCRLKEHQIIHTNLRPFTCGICQKSFNRRYTLRVHVKSHSKERPHICKICNKGFTQAHSLRAHLLIHSRDNT